MLASRRATARAVTVMPDGEVAPEVSQDEATLKEARILWRKYFLLTEELLKYSDQRDSDLFVELVKQRGQLIEKLEALPKNNYRESEEGQALIKKIIPMDNQIIYRARTWLNKSRRQNSTVRSYDLVGSIELNGTIFNRKY